MATSDNQQLPILFLHTPGKDFVRPYFERNMTEYTISDRPDDAECAVMISTTDVYDAEEGLCFNELTPLRLSSDEVAEEKRFADICRSHGLKPSILRCADIVGTGMTGFPRELANKVYRATHLNILGNTAVRSLVHASSLPDAARIALTQPDIYNVTDRTDTLLNDFADALAWRISQKRVFSLGPKWFKSIFGKANYARQTRSLTFSCEKLCSAGNFKPVKVVDYLKNHIYDESSL